MDPITASAITAAVGYLAKKLKDNKSFKDFTNDFTEATVNWIRPIFLKPDNTPKEVLAKLEQKPDSDAIRKMAEAAIAEELEEKPEAKKLLKEMHEVIKSKQVQNQTNVTSSKNVNTGTISAGGSVSIGDSESRDK